ncbi:MAG: hypothetical protein M1821_006940 [Bathelium mastoideum]|nr:MAG: hypothetical protein M1821_006940 [Bathelium mastoideum]
MKVSVFSILSLTIFATTSAIPTPLGQSDNITDLEKRDPPFGIGSGVNVFYDNNHRIRIFGAIAITNSAWLQVLMEYDSGRQVAEAVGSSIYQHCQSVLESQSLNSYNQLITAQATFETIYHEFNIVTGRIYGTVGLAIDSSRVYIPRNPAIWLGYVNEVANYFRGQGFDISLKSVNDVTAIGGQLTVDRPLKTRSLEKRKTQFCIEPIDFRSAFTNDMPVLPTDSAVCAPPDSDP